MACAGENNPSRLTPTAPQNTHPNELASHVETRHSSLTYKDFEKLQHQAFAMVQKGLNADEDGDITTARQCYLHSLSLLEHVLNADCRGWRHASWEEIEAGEEIQRRMSKTKLQVLYRMGCLQGGGEEESSTKQACGESASALSDAAFSSQTGGEVPEYSTSLGSEAGGEGVKLPSYEEAISSLPSSPASATPTSGARITMATTLGDPRTLDLAGHRGERLSPEDGTEIFRVEDGVQIFHISCDGYVTAPSYPTSLHIVSLQSQAPDMESEGRREGGGRDDSAPVRAFLQVGDWVYPLIPHTSPILHTAFGAYLFPDLSPEGSGSSVGLMLPDTMSEGERHMMEDILRNMSNVQEQQDVIMPPAGEDDNAMSPPPSYTLSPPEPQAAAASDTERGGEEDGEREEHGGMGRRYGYDELMEDLSASAFISRGILAASSWISWGLAKGTEKAGEWIAYGSEKLRDNLQPDSFPTPVHPHVQKGAMYARKASNCAVTVSCFIVTKLGEATVALARTVVPHIREKGEKYLPPSVKTEQNKACLSGFVEVAASGLHGIATVWLSLEASAKALGRSLATETVATVQHKFGQDAGMLAENTVYAAGNMAMTAYTARSLAMKAIAKRTARETGKALVYNLRGGEEGNLGEGSWESERKEEGSEREKENKKLPL